MTEELWEQVGGAYSIHAAAWPEVDEELARRSEVEIAVQIDGRTRDVIQVEAGSDEESAVSSARQSSRVERHLDGKDIVRTIFVPDRLINFVTRGRR
jgi:leucyl-tRNA synthetase